MSSGETARSSEQRTESTGASEWAGWLAAAVGLWILITPFFLGGGGGSSLLFWSNIVSGVVVVAALAGWTASQ